MSLDVYLTDTGYRTGKEINVYWANITHNSNIMAKEAGIYKALWRPEEIDAKIANDIVPLLEEGLEKMKSDPEYYKQFNSPNGWGMYKHFVPFVEEYLEACKEYPRAIIRISR